MKRPTMLLSLLCLAAAPAVPASTLGYDIATPGDPEYGKPTSVKPVTTADRGELSNADVSKDAALVPPAFGSPTAYAPNTGTPLAPNLAPDYMLDDGAVINGSTGTTITPPDYSDFPNGGTSNVLPIIGSTEVTSDLYYQGGYPATLKIPSIDVNVKVCEGTRGAMLRKGAGHFEDTSVWAGNVRLVAHNRGMNTHFGEIHTLDIGDKITLVTKLGKRTYAMTSVNKISKLDNSLLSSIAENCITLFTCIRNQNAHRWMVQAVKVS